MGVVINKGGMLTTVQDEGRFGYQQYGVSPAGPMDARAFHLANLLVGNEFTQAALEITVIGPELYFEQDIIIAVTGADLQPCLNGVEMANDQAVRVHQGDTLSFKGMRNGVRAYLAFAGGLTVPEVMGSKATLMRNALGGVEGRALKEGDRLGFAGAKGDLPNLAGRKLKPTVYPTQEIALRVVAGPQEEAFTAEGIRQFYRFGAKISPEFDRMGCRLECDVPIEHAGAGSMITDGIAFGSIQIPPSGQPIIMLADRQTVGGYPKIATVISADLPVLAQALPGCRVRFVRVSVETAQLVYRRELEELAKLREYINKVPC